MQVSNFELKFHFRIKEVLSRKKIALVLLPSILVVLVQLKPDCFMDPCNRLLRFWQTLLPLASKSASSHFWLGYFASYIYIIDWAFDKRHYAQENCSLWDGLGYKSAFSEFWLGWCASCIYVIDYWVIAKRHYAQGDCSPWVKFLKATQSVLFVFCNIWLVGLVCLEDLHNWQRC